mmetsp:Transcript_4543/g.10172  ORF Transcript_4543/g.10172 Transcript_4543/m.10172 type:complete len:351 (+) Transcript_4543:129-1181(+)
MSTNTSTTSGTSALAQGTGTTRSDNSSLCIAAVQAPLRHDSLHPLDAARSVVRTMKSAVAAAKHPNTIDLFVLPELCPLGYSEHTFQNYLHSDAILDGISMMIAQFAAEHKVYVCYGTVGKLDSCSSTTQSQSQQTSSGSRSRLCATNDSVGKQSPSPPRTIRSVIVNDIGAEIACYDKLHLCDYGNCAETRFFSPGGELCSFACRGFRIGLIICADMRYPNLSRKLAGDPRHTVDAIIQPAAFARDISFRTWKSFRETRAVENGVYFIGINYAGESYGETSLNEPWIDEHHEPLVLGTREGVLLGSIKRSTLIRAREEMPFYRQLRTSREFRDSETVRKAKDLVDDIGY